MPRLTNNVIDSEEKNILALEEIKNAVWRENANWDIIKVDDTPALSPKSDLQGKICLFVEKTAPAGGGRRVNLSQDANGVKRIRIAINLDDGLDKYWPEASQRQRHIYVSADGLYDRVGIIDFIAQTSSTFYVAKTQKQKDDLQSAAHAQFMKKLEAARARKPDRAKQQENYNKVCEVFKDKIDSRYEPNYVNVRIGKAGVMKISVTDTSILIPEITIDSTWKPDKIGEVAKILASLEGML